ncbi:MAG TPA: hypothetical protein VMS55_03605 [Myxococcota bacterium]|nr:hypothetical protein [Myxococcota bacterium]
MPHLAALVLAVALMAVHAQAELVDVDLLAPGDGLVTRDSSTDLDWLDLGGVTWLLRTGATPDAIPASTASTTRGSFLVRATPPEVPALPRAGVALLAALLALACRRAVAS